jgi:hypothetical protein
MESVDWIYLAQDRDKSMILVNTVITIRVVLNVMSLFTISGIFGSSSRNLLQGVC